MDGLASVNGLFSLTNVNYDQLETEQNRMMYVGHIKAIILVALIAIEWDTIISTSHTIIRAIPSTVSAIVRAAIFIPLT